MIRRLPPAIRQYVAPRLAVAALIGLVALGLCALAIFNARSARDFERHAAVTTAIVGPDLEGDDLHVPVEFAVDGTVVRGLAPVTDRRPYEPDESVDVRYDPSDPTVVQLVEQPYDLAMPLAFGAGLALLAGAYALAVAWRARRVVRLAASSATSYAFNGRVRYEDRVVGRDRAWVDLAALDGADAAGPVAALPLLPGQALPSDPTFSALVKGDVRDGGTAVVLAADRVLWPAGPLRVGRVRRG